MAKHTRRVPQPRAGRPACSEFECEAEMKDKRIPVALLIVVALGCVLTRPATTEESAQAYGNTVTLAVTPATPRSQ